MPAAPRGSVVLVVGVSAALLCGVFFALLRMRSSLTPVALPQTALEHVPETVRAPLGEFASLVPPAPSSTQTRAQRWQLLREGADGPCLLVEEGAIASSSVGVISGRWCTLLGPSLEGRYVHVLSGSHPGCAFADVCEHPPIVAWTVYDVRIGAFRPVPTPIRQGYWQAVDPTRGIGVFQGVIQSTRQEGTEDFWAVTDVAGAALWTGRSKEIDPQAVTLLGQRLLSRRDGAVLFSYLAVDEAQQATLRLNVFMNARWQPVTLPEEIRSRAWRLESWEQAGRTWQAVIAWVDDAGVKRTVKVVTP